MKQKQKKEIKDILMFSQKGVSIIEALILVFIFSVVTLSFYSVFSVGTRYIMSSKNRIVATSLANEEMEKLRNLSYDEVALQGGIPSGSIDPDKVVTIGDKGFRVVTDIKYYDDPDDGVFNGSPLDNVPNDYKIVEVFVYWGEQTNNERVLLTSRFVPPGVENSAGGGTFSVNAIDYSGNPVSDVTVNIFNDQISPNVNYTTHTDSNGNLLLQGVPGDAVQNYKITMSKSGYETVVTYPTTTVGFIPAYLHSNIIAGALNEKTMVINMLSDLTIRSKDSFGNDLPDVDFDLSGGRRLDDGTVEPGVYNYSDSVSTDSSGEFSLNDISPGKYILSNFSFASGDYEFRKVELGDDLNSSALNLIAGDDFSTNAIFMDKNLESVFLTIKDSITNTPISGASVKLKNDSLGYDVTLITDKYGNVYFPNESSNPLQGAQSYDILITNVDYQDKSDSIISNKLTKKEISLDAK